MFSRAFTLWRGCHPFKAALPDGEKPYVPAVAALHTGIHSVRPGHP
jgi:hypothetical protein